ncbi:MAG: pseudouridine synthase [Comamonadaceae bacterium]|nr:pseudouridine synthase [Comamonadaceae bacterium]
MTSRYTRDRRDRSARVRRAAPRPGPRGAAAGVFAQSPEGMDRVGGDPGRRGRASPARQGLRRRGGAGPGRAAAGDPRRTPGAAARAGSRGSRRAASSTSRPASSCTQAPATPTGRCRTRCSRYDPGLAALPRAGIVHRLDKDTSGLLIVARTLPAHTGAGAHARRARTSTASTRRSAAA